jgi:hypothetical protein
MPVNVPRKTRLLASITTCGPGNKMMLFDIVTDLAQSTCRLSRVSTAVY